MKLGIKVGNFPESVIDLEATNAQSAEVWYLVNRGADYQEFFKYLMNRKIDVGLHFWATTGDGYLANIADPTSPDIINESKALIKRTIEIAALNQFKYVNIHPGSAAKIKVELGTWIYHEIIKTTDYDAASDCFLENALEMNEFARSLGVILTVETVPPRASIGSLKERLTSQSTLNAYELPLAVIIRAAESGIHIANDFSHTAANFADLGTPASIQQELSDFTARHADMTKLVHIGFIKPPYNGTDYHGSLDEKILESNDAVPNYENLIKLLGIFKNRNDVWGLVEPAADHKQNYFLAKKLIDAS